MEKEFDLLVYIGRFQVPHNGHFKVMQTALEKAHNVLVVIGSSNSSRNLRNPFTADERKDLILAGMDSDSMRRLYFGEVQDFPYNDALWCQNVQTVVQHAVNGMARPVNPKKIGLIGYGKDGTSFYLKLFPQWHSVGVEPVNRPEGGTLSSSDLRKVLFDPNMLHGINDVAPYLQEGTLDMLRHLQLTAKDEVRDIPMWDMIREEAGFIDRYKQAWASAPYKPTFVTVDAVVVQSGHILMITRKANPGKGLLALPGGFVNQDERLIDAALRELREETRLKVPTPVLKGSLVQHREFDDPHRSLRGRTITMAYLFRLEDRAELPPVKGGDDAAKAEWIPLSELRSNHVYEDHYAIIQTMVGSL